MGVDLRIPLCLHKVEFLSRFSRSVVVVFSKMKFLKLCKTSGKSLRVKLTPSNLYLYSKNGV